MYKKDLYKIIPSLDTKKLAEISKVSKYVNFQRGTKTAIRNLIKQTKTQQDLQSIAESINSLLETQDKGIEGMIETYLTAEVGGTGFRKAKFYEDQ